ncbi:hypothetical protein PTSG_05846 [Salpingoeca rosetta]|uniref:Uncharacterized protein n=1 Tax=Salpingoeca rosetta (strain ATCC 50818 / BSB-021) TaxID=946362 RepID=F2UCY7_SALR5|nr:uncharacterized protein PTSG_05846 [Salpingoeca rosetta]EGD74482.1 hypothetical protein PTSG_05846 [Salpingoeca rosetta]|eukprot:XP_004992739.1 hypothetical protein PTSG_05846 [Salpingoeca rosetta]
MDHLSLVPSHTVIFTIAIIISITIAIIIAGANAQQREGECRAQWYVRHFVEHDVLVHTHAEAVKRLKVHHGVSCVEVVAVPQLVPVDRVLAVVVITTTMIDGTSSSLLHLPIPPVSMARLSERAQQLLKRQH